ncbi:MAG: hypothetical protein ABI234_20400 [Ktedonobacteraceae bacterium]
MPFSFFSAPPDGTPLLEKIVQHVPCYRLHQSFLAIAAAAQAVVALARSHTQGDALPGVSSSGVLEESKRRRVEEPRR